MLIHKLVSHFCKEPSSIYKIAQISEPNYEQTMKTLGGGPDGDDDVINKYGTYEIQRTNGMENPYPMIAQGLSEQEAQEQLNAAERWKKK